MHFREQRVAVITPHCDDETLGCGGFLSKFRDHFARLDIALCSTGDVLHRNGLLVKKKQRLEEFESVCSILRAESRYFGFEDRRLYCQHEDLVYSIDEFLDDVSPTVLFAPSVSFHQDHRTVYEAVYASLRPGRQNIQYVLLYETPENRWTSEDEIFIPNLYVVLDRDIIAMKNALVEEYTSQDRASLETVVKWAERRGFEAGEAAFAEAFRLVRAIL